MKDPIKRRSFLKGSLLGGAFLGLPTLGFTGRESSEEIVDKISRPTPAFGKSVVDLKVDPIEQVKVGVIGVGMRGSGHVRQFAALYPDKAIITAICDIREEQVEKSVDFLKDKGIKKVATYSGTKDAWREMIKRDDIDLIIIATPWELHAEMSIESMRAGKHVGVEVPIALTVEDCWNIVNTAEETQRNCMMLENVCYGNEELWVLNMVQEGVFGTLTHGEAAYIHDLRGDYLFTDAYYNMWRIRHHAKLDGNLYPTHGLGPVAQYMDIGRGDRFSYMVSMSSKQAALTEYSKKVDPSNEFYNRSDFKHGDMNSSLIKTNDGRSILVQHDVVTPRPYDRLNALGGTKAFHAGYPSRLSIDGKGHGWLEEEEYAKYRQEYNHPIWENLKEAIAKNGGHGGMDFVMTYRMIDCLNKGWALDMDVYDAADWSVVTPLSVISNELGSIPVKFPDFMRGKWQNKRQLGIIANM